MQRVFRPLVSITLGILVILSISAQAQEGTRFLSLTPEGGLPIIPVMEGWVANPDGTYSYSFGAINRNKEAVTIELGGSNYIEPTEFNGVQPTHFPAGRSTGVFTVTVPADKADIDVWWHLKTSSSDELKVPGRSGVGAYELDFIRPRPQGSLQPLVGLNEDGPRVAGLSATIGDFAGTVTAGTAVELSVNVQDPSQRDPSDDRFEKPLDMGATFNKWQGPGDVEFTRHESTVVPTNPYKEGDRRARFFRTPGVNVSAVPGGEGIARVYATFSEPGDYIIHTKVDNFKAPDSSDGDQCCWTNVYQRVTVR